MFSIHAELKALTGKLHEERIPYALCGALALAVHGYPRATLDIDLLALGGSSDRIQGCARALGFTLPAAPMQFADGTVRIRRLSKALPGTEDVLMVDVLTVSSEIERKIAIQSFEWEKVQLVTVTRESLVMLKKLRGNPQDLADIEKLR